MVRKVKFQFEMPEANANRLDELAKQAGVTRKDIINSALTLFEWAITEVQSGRTISSVDEGAETYKELVFPILTTFALAKRE